MSQIEINIIPKTGDEKYQVVKFAGQLDESNVDKNSKTIYDLIETMPEGDGLILDFADLDYMNSKSIGFLTDWHLKINDKGGKLVVAASQENILDILEVVGLTQIIEMKPTLDEAKQLFVGASTSTSLHSDSNSENN